MSDTNKNSDATERSVVDINGIMEMIPHRYPFLMIDKVVDIVPSKSATGIKCVSMAEPHFQGHFPVQPIMPGVLIIEAMAQTAAVLVVHSTGVESEGKVVYFMSIDNALPEACSAGGRRASGGQDSTSTWECLEIDRKSIG